jgi:phosphoribosylformimino-5-aminoimidazole carboxamide ribonucleotide (ProFAR) isomerase
MCSGPPVLACQGAILGRSLYERTIDLTEALAHA